jgi:hypothetical protein
VEFGVLQIVDVALKAISPAVSELQRSGRAEVKRGNQPGSSFGGGLDLVPHAAK